MSKSILDQLFEAGLKAQKMSHSPYSKCKVGSAIMTDKGIFAGCNVENGSYPAGICAEQTAVVKAISEGAKTISSVVIISPEEEPWAPCGVCRQVLSEFCTADTEVHMLNQSGKKIQSLSFKELLPMAFKLNI